MCRIIDYTLLKQRGKAHWFIDSALDSQSMGPRFDPGFPPPARIHYGVHWTAVSSCAINVSHFTVVFVPLSIRHSLDITWPKKCDF